MINDGSQEGYFAERVQEYAEALRLGDLYREKGGSVDELGQPLRPRKALSRCACTRLILRTETSCIFCREPARWAAMKE